MKLLQPKSFNFFQLGITSLSNLLTLDVSQDQILFPHKASLLTTLDFLVAVEKKEIDLIGDLAVPCDIFYRYFHGFARKIFSFMPSLATPEDQ